MVVIPDQNTWPGRTDTDGLRQRLLNWFAEHGRDLPWRHTRDPYRVLVSEIMLQQTQVDRVIPPSSLANWLTVLKIAPALNRIVKTSNCFFQK